MSSPYLIEGPAIISFSMGRTSGYMLKQIIDAHGGTLPDDVHVVTSNTGKEREESLRFGHECASRWGFDWHLIEYRDDEIGAERVGLNSASRDGEPFTALILKKGYVPNRGGPYCSIELKARTTRDYVRAIWGWKNWKAVLGLRHDEQQRVLGAIGRNHSGKDPWRNVMPLDTAKVSKRDIDAYWRAQDFDLGLLNYQGNCTRCWKKSESKRRLIIRDEQAGRTLADPWWREMEEATGTTFDLRLSHAELERQVHAEPMMLLDVPDLDEAEEECGFTCFISDADQAEAA